MTKKKTKRKAGKKRTTKDIKKAKKRTIKAKVVIPAIETSADEVSKPSTWFNSVQKGENVTSSHIWHVNKERLFKAYGNKYWAYWDRDGKPVRASEKPDEKTYGHQHARLIAVLPDGKVITPVRQFCEHRPLPAGQREAFFYDFGSINILASQEGIAPEVTTPTITSHRAETNPRGTRIDIGYNEVEESPIDIIASANRAFGLESVNDENVEIIDRTFNDDSYTVGKEEIRQKGGGLKMWVDNFGSEIRSDDWMVRGDNELTIRAVFSALNKILDQGLDITNAIMYTSGAGARQLLDDPEFLERKKHSLLESPLFLLEKILGIRVIVSSACPATDTVDMVPIEETYWQRFRRVLLFKRKPMEDKGKIGTRSIVFIPRIAFGLVTGETLTMEAQRRNERQVVTLTGTQRTSGILKNKECAVRISHA